MDLVVQVAPIRVAWVDPVVQVAPILGMGGPGGPGAAPMDLSSLFGPGGMPGADAASSAATCRSIQRRTSAGSSRTMVLPVTTCPAASSSDTIAAPPVSVASERVSLIVSTAQRIAAGAWARCSV